MRLYLVRSAHATELSRPARSAPVLSNRGRLQALSLANYARRLAIAPCRMVIAESSAACETAALLTPVLGAASGSSVDRVPADARIFDVLDILREQAHERCVLVIADNPLIGELLHVVCSPEQTGGAPYLMRRGEMVTVTARAGQLVGTARVVSRFCMGNVETAEMRSAPVRAATIAA